MGEKWATIQKLLPNDDDLTRVLHWSHYRDGRTCASRARLVRHLRIPKAQGGPGWSFEEIADVLGLTRNHTAKLAKTGASGTTASSATQTSPIPLEITANPSLLNFKGITGSEKTKYERRKPVGTGDQERI